MGLWMESYFRFAKYQKKMQFNNAMDENQIAFKTSTYPNTIFTIYFN
jgi:hypothetical protein